MPKFSEEAFDTWRRPPSAIEDKKLFNAREQVRDAICNDKDLQNFSIEIFGQGAYANDTNVCPNSDIDIIVMYKDEHFYSLPQGKTNNEFGIIISDTLSYTDYKDLVENALVHAFGKNNVRRSNKSIKVLGNATRGECDVVPTFQFKMYSEDETYEEGIKFFTDTFDIIESFPKQHTKNALGKNAQTNRKYKRTTRIFKKLRCQMENDGVELPDSITSFLIECLTWNVPNHIYNNNEKWSKIVREAILFLYYETSFIYGCKDWGEVSELNYLFHSKREWSTTDVNNYLQILWNYLEFK